MYCGCCMICEMQWAMNGGRSTVNVCDVRYTAGDLRGSFGRRTFVFTAFCVWAMCGVDIKLIREKIPKKSQYAL